MAGHAAALPRCAADSTRSHPPRAGALTPRPLPSRTHAQWSWPFNHPVDTKVYKDYLVVVETPLDFTTITRRINSGYYRHPDTFLAEVRLVFTNARAYNKPGSDVFVMANTLQVGR